MCTAPHSFVPFQLLPLHKLARDPTDALSFTEAKTEAGESKQQHIQGGTGWLRVTK